ncbi:hypothetical protein JCM10207_008887 [Rhodosporidiobolus poonsookiae]
MQPFNTGLTSYPDPSSSSHFPPPLPSTSTSTPAPSLPDSAKNRAPRTLRACTACRKRKVRCDGTGGPVEANQSGVAEQPCSLCLAQGIPCTYEERPQKKPAPKGYVEALEKRLEAMESLLTSLSHKTGVDISQMQLPARAPGVADTDDLVATAGAAGSEAMGGGEQESRSRPPSPPPTTLDAISKLGEKLDDLAIETDRYIGRGSGLHLVQSVHEHLSVAPPAGKDTPSLVDNLLKAEHDRLRASMTLPPPDLAGKLVDAWFAQSASWPMLVRQDFEDNIKRGLLQSDMSFRALYMAVCAIGSRFVDDPRLDPPPSIYSAAAPRETRIARGYTYFWSSCAAASTPLVSASLFDLQANVLQILWLLGSTGLLASWTAVGFAIRRAVDVGAHRESRTRWTASPLQDQLRRRTFHALWSLDRFISSMLGRPLAIQDEDVDLGQPRVLTDQALLEWDHRARAAAALGRPAPPPPPLSEAELVPPAAPGAQGKRSNTIWECMIGLHAIMGRAFRLLFGIQGGREKSLKQTRESVCELDSLLNGWLELVPPELVWNPAEKDGTMLQRSGWLMCAYYQVQILVHREYISPSRSRALGFPSLAICSNAARSCARVLDTLRQRRLMEMAYTWAPLVAVNSGLILLLGTFANPPGPPGSAPATLTASALSDVQRCLTALESLSHSSFMALKCFDGLQRLGRLIAPASFGPPQPGDEDGWCGPTTSSSPTTTSPTATLRNPLAGSLKRSNPDYDGAGSGGGGSGFTPILTPSDGTSPASSSDKPSPTTSGAAEGTSTSNKARKVANLPFSTHDLSASTFNGRPTWALPPSSSSASASSSAAAAAAPFAGAQHPPQQQTQWLPTYAPDGTLDLNNLGGIDFAALINGGGASGAEAFGFPASSAPQQPQQQASFVSPSSAGTASTAAGTHFSPFSASAYASTSSTNPSSFPSATPPSSSAPLSLPTDFWALPIDDTASVPPAVGQEVADLMANFGLPELGGTGLGMVGGLGSFGFGGGAAFDGFGGAEGGAWDAFGTAGAGGEDSVGYDASLFGGLSPFAAPSAPPTSNGGSH